MYELEYGLIPEDEPVEGPLLPEEDLEEETDEDLTEDSTDDVEADEPSEDAESSETPSE